MRRDRPLPERTCVGCRNRALKGQLIRVVLSPSGGIEVDPTGAAPGRGAYLHRDPECLQRAGKQGVLAHALRAPISGGEVSNLLESVRRAEVE